MNFTSIPTIEKYHNTFHLLEKESKTHYFKDVEPHTIELNKFEQKNLRKGDELQQLSPRIKTSSDRWATFLTGHDLLESKKLPKQLNDPKL